GFVEAHGAAHPEWDGVEVEAMRRVFGGRAAPLAVGASKTRLGNTLGASSLLGVIKAACALSRRTLFGEQAPRASVAGEDLAFDQAPRAFPEPASGPRRAAVTALGLGGAHAHATLEAFDTAFHRALVAGVAPKPRGPMRVAIVAMGAVLPGAAD